MKGSAYLPFYKHPPIWISLPFFQENLEPPPFMTFQKSQSPYNLRGRGTAL